MTTQRLITMMKAAVHPNTENPVFGDGVIYVEVHDDAAGAFVTLSQPTASQIDPEYTGKVMIDYETDWPAVVQAVHTLMHQPGLKDIAT